MRAEVMQGECLAILREMESASVDAIITDPPYSSGGFTRGDRTADPTTKYVQSGQDKQWASFGGDSRLPGVWSHSIKQSDKHHLTGKPTALMQEVVRICPPGGVILDPFAGSGSTGVGALLEGRSFIGIERDPHYAEVARTRLAEAQTGLSLAA